MRSRVLAAVIVLSLVACAQSTSGQKANFSSESQVVVLHVAVRDRRGYVNGLDQAAFRIFENNQPQPISFFNNQDTPVTVGLLIDNSGSMGANRDRVIAAALAFARNSNPQDEIFVLGFNENLYVPLPPEAPFTRDLATLSAALNSAIHARGQTAVYNAVGAGLEYVNKGTYERKVLVLVSDGGDNASSIRREQVLARAQASNAVIYTVGVIDPLETEADPAFLRQLSQASGGQSFEPHSVADVRGVLERIAHDIRNMYTLGYVPASIAQKEELRRVSVNVKLPAGGKATVRTRRAYLAGQGLGRSSNDESVAR